MAAQLTATNGPRRRAEWSWIVRAMSSFPVPLSPSTSTVASVGATCSICRVTSCMEGAPATRRPNAPRCRSSRRSRWTSRALSALSRARSRTNWRRAGSSGLVR